MKTLRFNYWTNLMRCGCGGNVGGNAAVNLDEQEEKAFLEALVPAKEGRDMLGYFRDNLSPSLSDRICGAVIADFQRVREIVRHLVAADVLRLQSVEAVVDDAFRHPHEFAERFEQGFQGGHQGGVEVLQDIDGKPAVRAMYLKAWERIKAGK